MTTNSLHTNKVQLPDKDSPVLSTLIYPYSFNYLYFNASQCARGCDFYLNLSLCSLYLTGQTIHLLYPSLSIRPVQTPVRLAPTKITMSICSSVLAFNRFHHLYPQLLVAWRAVRICIYQSESPSSTSLNAYLSKQRKRKSSNRDRYYITIR